MTDLAIALVLVLVAIAVSVRARLALEKELVVATLRALVQLAVVAAIVQFVFDDLRLSAVFLVVMLAAAGWTSRHRLQGVPGGVRIALTAISVGSLIPFSVLFGARVFPLEPRWVIPIAGMLIGNGVIATSLAGSRVRDEMLHKAVEVESRLALGVRARDALTPYVRRAAANALIPIVDATKNAGVIHLPGAFVGMMLGGASPLQAARVQLIVLFMLLAAVSLTAITATAAVARAFVYPGERIVLPVDTVR